MSKQGLEKIVASLELCKLIPAGEFEDSALVWMYRPALKGISDTLFMVDMRVKAEYLKREMYPAPTLEEIWRELRNLSVNVIDGSITVSCRIDPDETLYETAGDDNEMTSAALRLWLKLKGIEVKA